MQPEKIIFKGGVEVHFSLDAGDTNKQVILFKCRIAPGARVPVPHFHEHFDETVYGLKGIADYTVDGNKIRLGPGDCLFIPRGTSHGFVNNTKETIEFLCYISPGVFDAGYFREIAAVVNKQGPPDIDKIKSIMKSYGLVPVLTIKHRLLFFLLRIIRTFKK
jgi:quercetin dioxygenase-like cupin family protein